MYAEDSKKLVFIALGGIHTNKTEIINISNVDHAIYMCTWKRILTSVQEKKYDIELGKININNEYQIINILNDIVLCFELFGFATADWFERFIPAPHIQEKSIHYLSQSWTK